uniref:30S ribosomal protein S11 n=1 Tax=Dunaliella tertiolecta TaxID=3047 RepID=A0A7S3VJ66_DUNTE|mmetsp:Transcript_15750/g.42799  ORF Transcript_15750/g.42799 Transcript_15750/m.42799 type:complete len:239 (+) Transcript_15750:20-736(+)
MLPQLARRLGLSLGPSACNAWAPSAVCASRQPLAVLWPPVFSSSSFLEGQQRVCISSSPALHASEEQQEAGSSAAVAAPQEEAGGGAAAATRSSSGSSTSTSSRSDGVSSGFRRVRSQLDASQGALQGIIHITNSFNNIIVALTDNAGNLKSLVSAGHVGFKNARKSQPAAAEKAADELARRALNLGYSTVVVKMKGAGSNKQVAVQSLHAAGLRIKTLMDVTGIPYNGCRAPKRRRV